MNPTAEMARKTARRKNARRTTLALFAGLALGMTLGIVLADKRGLPLPNRFEPVYVINSNGRAHTATLWEDGKFHSVETGETLPQIVKWSRP